MGVREPILMRFNRSSLAYEGRQVAWPIGPFVPARPGAALSAIAEALPVEALGAAALVALLLYFSAGQDAAVSGGMVAALAFVLVQMARERVYLTPTRLVREHGLFFTRRRVTLLKDVRSKRVEEAGDLGDIVLSGDFGEVRIRAVRHPQRTLHRLSEILEEAHRAA